MRDESISRRSALAVIPFGLTGCLGLTKATIENPTPLPDTRGRVYFMEPQEGALITSPFRVLLGLSGYDLREAGDIVYATGHHHLVIDRDPVPEGTQIPYPGDFNYRHYGAAANLRTPITVELPVGKHTLHAQLGDGAHIALGRGFTATIRIEVIPAPLG